MRSIFALACLALLFAHTPACAGEPLRVDARTLGPDGVLTRQAADVMGNDGPSRTPLVAIDAPPAGGRIAGTVESFEVDGEAWLELAAVYADGRREVVRSHDGGDPSLRLIGTTATRSFALAVPRAADGAAPARIELTVGMLGPGVVSLSALRFEAAGAQAAPAAPVVPRWQRFALAALAGLALGAALALRRRGRFAQASDAA